MGYRYIPFVSENGVVVLLKHAVTVSHGSLPPFGELREVLAVCFPHGDTTMPTHPDSTEARA